MQLSIPSLKKFLDNSLLEDLGVAGDITSKALIEEDKNVQFFIKTREPMICAGLEIVSYFFTQHAKIKYEFFIKDGEKAPAGMVLAKGFGNAIEVLMLERTILNYLQHLSAIATLTETYVEKISATKAKICDTRKTIPGLRRLQKYAVTCGGGNNHRYALDSAILIKDNHIAICGGVKQALEKAKASAPHFTKIEIECDNLVQVTEAVTEGVDIIMLDNMQIEQINEAIRIINHKALIEVSGGVNLANVREIAETGVDFISIGKLTNSAAAIDIGLDIL